MSRKGEELPLFPFRYLESTISVNLQNIYYAT